MPISLDQVTNSHLNSGPEATSTGTTAIHTHDKETS